MLIHTLPLGPLDTNCYIVSAGESGRCVVVDPGGSVEVLTGWLQEHALRVEAVLLTHGHFDHIGAVAALLDQFGMPVYLCEADADEKISMGFSAPVYTDACQEGDVLHLAGLSFRVLQTPGHTPGSVCYLCANHLFCGDTLFAGSAGRTDFPGGSTESMLASLRRLCELEGDYCVHPGHGESTLLSRERQYNPWIREAMRR